MFQLHSGVPRYSDVGFEKSEGEKGRRLCGKRLKDVDEGEVGSFEVEVCSGSCATDGAMMIVVIIHRRTRG